MAGGIESGAATVDRPWWRRHLGQLLALACLAVVVALAVLAIARDRAAFSAALAQIGWGSIALSTGFGLAAIAATYGIWVCSLASLEARLPVADAIPAFFVSQLGKYLPGSVWPVLAQMEAGHRSGVRRRTMLSGNLLTLAVSLAVGALVACALLPLGSRAALERFWWLFLALPVLLAMLHPRILPALMDRLFRLARRPPLDQRLRTRDLLRAVAWTLFYWALLGTHIAVLCWGLGLRGGSVLVLSSGAMALAVTVGVLFVPVPAGAGLREGALVLALAPVLTAGQGLAVAIVSRVELIVVDLVLAGGALAVRAALRRRPVASRAAEPG